MKTTTAILLGVIAMSVSCRDREGEDAESSTTAQIEAKSDRIPESFSEAMIALDKRYTAEEKSAFLEREGGSYKVLGMQLRNDWGLWRDSPLKRYFAERGITHADYVSAAIIEGWDAHLRSGIVDEAAIIKKYMLTEELWKVWQEEHQPDNNNATNGDGPFPTDNK